MGSFYTPMSRIIFTKNLLGRRQIKETLCDLLIGLIISPEDFILVSPWVSDFELLDNRSGNWNNIEPAWGTRHIKFSEIIIRAMHSGCNFTLVTNYDEMNLTFIQKLKNASPDTDIFKYKQTEILNLKKSDKVHIKGLLASKFFLAGSMNFTYSGTHINEEQVQLNIDSDTIIEAQLEFKDTYGL